MGYSNYHKNKNPFSPARLDEAFKASKMEGGPGDPVKVEVKKDVEAGEVTVTKYSEGESGQKPLTPEQKAWRDEQIKSLGSVEAYREKYNIKSPQEKDREALQSFTYRKMTPDKFSLKPMDIDYNITMASDKGDTPVPDEGFKYTTSETKRKKSKIKDDDPKIKGSGLEECSPENPTACGLDPNKSAKEVAKATKQREKLERKAQSDPTKSTFNPKAWFEQKKSDLSKTMSMNQASRDRKKRQREINKISRKRMKGKLNNESPFSRTLTGNF